MSDKKHYEQYVNAVEYSQNLEKLLHMERENIAVIRAELEAAERERDELRAELARREAAAGEPVGLIRENPDDIGLMAEFEVMPPAGTKLYTAARPAVLPPEVFMSDAIKGNVTSDFMDGANWMRQQCLDLGAQQQKAVELPASKSMLSRNSLDEDYVTCIAVPLSDLTEALDAANVKWEVNP